MPIYAQGSQTRVLRPSIAVPGLFLSKPLTIEAVNLADEAAQVTTLQLTAATASTNYSVTVNGFTVSFTTPATIVMADLQSLLLDKLQTSPEVSGSFTIAKSSTDSVVLTAVASGILYPIAGSTLITATQTTAPLSAGQISFGRVLTGRKKTVGGVPVCGVPSATTQKAIGVAQYNHGISHYLQGPDGIERGGIASLVVEGQGWIEFESQADMSIAGSLFFRAVPSGAQVDTGKLVYAASAPTGFSAFRGNLDSETSTIADGRIVGLVTYSLV